MLKSHHRNGSFILTYRLLTKLEIKVIISSIRRIHNLITSNKYNFNIILLILHYKLTDFSRNLILFNLYSTYIKRSIIDAP